MKINTKFDIHQPVKIIELGRKGRIRCISVDSDGLQYKIRYFDNAEAKDVWFYEDEIAPNL